MDLVPVLADRGRDLRRRTRITAWSGGWRARLLAVLLFPELAYDVFLQIVFAKCLLDITLARTASWKHVTHARPRETTGAERS